MHLVDLLLREPCLLREAVMILLNPRVQQACRVKCTKSIMRTKQHQISTNTTGPGGGVGLGGLSEEGALDALVLLLGDALLGLGGIIRNARRLKILIVSKIMENDGKASEKQEAVPWTSQHQCKRKCACSSATTQLEPQSWH